GIDGFDPGLMHNAIFHWFGRGIGRYSSRTRYVEVFLKINAGPVSSNDYAGLYLVEEKPKRAKDRVDIHSLQPENTNAASVTGGYMLKLDRQDPEERGFSVPMVGQVPPPPTPVIFVYPDGVPLTTDPRRAPQLNYIKSYILNFVTNLASPNYADPITG